MIAFFLKKVLSFAITIMTLFVPQEKYQKALEQLPDIPERFKEMNLAGWEFKQITSNETGETHYFFEYPSTDSAAPVLLCLHGFNTDGTVFFNLNTLSDKYRLIAYNFPERTKIYKGNIRDFDIILNDFCKTATLESVTLLGYSIGGGIAISYAANTRQVNVEKLILISTTVFGSTVENRRQIRGMADKLLDYPDYKLHFLLIRGSDILQKTEKSEVNNNDARSEVIIKHVNWYKEVLKAFYWYEGKVDAPFIKCPVMVIHGKKDKLIDQRETLATREVFPEADMYLLDDAAHSLVFSHASAVDSILRLPSTTVNQREEGGD